MTTNDCGFILLEKTFSQFYRDPIFLCCAVSTCVLTTWSPWLKRPISQWYVFCHYRRGRRLLANTLWFHVVPHFSMNLSLGMNKHLRHIALCNSENQMLNWFWWPIILIANRKQKWNQMFWFDFQWHLYFIPFYFTFSLLYFVFFTVLFSDLFYFHSVFVFCFIFLIILVNFNLIFIALFVIAHFLFLFVIVILCHLAF